MNQNALTGSDLRAGYDEDFYKWSITQAEAIRAGDTFDIENVAEEVESLGRREKRELAKHIDDLTLNVFKWSHYPQERSKEVNTAILTAWSDIQAILEDSPSLKACVERDIEEAYARAREYLAISQDVGIEALPDKRAEVVAKVKRILASDDVPDGL